MPQSFINCYNRLLPIDDINETHPDGVEASWPEVSADQNVGVSCLVVMELPVSALIVELASFKCHCNCTSFSYQRNIISQA